MRLVEIRKPLEAMRDPEKWEQTDSPVIQQGHWEVTQFRQVIGIYEEVYERATFGNRVRWFKLVEG